MVMVMGMEIESGVRSFSYTAKKIASSPELNILKTV